ncbi:MAG: chemotaxis protein CheW [Epsilonproteobacteria bacterium]|nr:chemotaxis protein CheW [Campylobacterota bacterium]
MLIEEILIIKNGHESYGISTAEVNQISRVPSLMQMPLRPAGVRGLCAVGGNIVTMVDMNLLLQTKAIDLQNDKCRILTLNDKFASNALLVSEVYNTIEVQEDRLEWIDNENDPIIGIYKYKKSLVQIVSLEYLFSRINRLNIRQNEVKSGRVKVTDSKEEDENRFLIFAMNEERFALNIDYLREIILADVEYTDVAGTSEDFLGLVTLRDELISVIDLRRYYGFRSTRDEKNRILIASFEGKKIGLLVDRIVNIKNFATKDIDYMPENFQDNMISGVIHDKSSLISFFDTTVLKEIFLKHQAYIDSQSDDEQNEVEDNSGELEVIVFKLSGKEYAFDVESVAEIIDNADKTKIAYAKENIDGIINIRGQIVTIVSLFKKLKIQEREQEDSKIIICNLKESKIGFVVDSVSDILSIKSHEIRTQDDRLFPNVLHLEGGKRLVLFMDINNVVFE